MTNRIPVPGFTGEWRVDYFQVYAPSGKAFAGLGPEVLADYGITVPEPRTGTLGLDEADTREMADAAPYEVASSPYAKGVNAAIAICAADVAAWDAADRAASRPPTPLGLSEDDVRTTAEDSIDYEKPLDWEDRGHNARNAACRAWVAEVDGGTES